MRASSVQRLDHDESVVLQRDAEEPRHGVRDTDDVLGRHIPQCVFNLLRQTVTRASEEIYRFDLGHRNRIAFFSLFARASERLVPARLLLLDPSGRASC